MDFNMDEDFNTEEELDWIILTNSKIPALLENVPDADWYLEENEKEF